MVGALERDIDMKRHAHLSFLQSSAELVALNKLRASGTAFGRITHGSAVTIRTPQGQAVTGRATLYNATQNCWVLNMGGKHGRPGIATPDNLVAVGGGR